jgi:hypothetical protein
MSFEFGKADVTVVVKVTCKRRYFVFEVESLSDPEVEQITLLNLAVTPSKYVSGMSGVAADDEFAVCVRTLDLRSLFSLGGSPAVFSARCERANGIAGAKLAVVGCPKAEIRGSGLPQGGDSLRAPGCGARREAALLRAGRTVRLGRG